MEIQIDCSVDRQRVLWVATCARFPEFIAEGKTLAELREEFPYALEAANLPRDATLRVRFNYDHGTRGAVLAASMRSGEVKDVDSLAVVPAGQPSPSGG